MKFVPSFTSSKIKGIFFKLLNIRNSRTTDDKSRRIVFLPVTLTVVPKSSHIAVYAMLFRQQQPAWTCQSACDWWRSRFVHVDNYSSIIQTREDGAIGRSVGRGADFASDSCHSQYHVAPRGTEMSAHHDCSLRSFQNLYIYTSLFTKVGSNRPTTNKLRTQN